MSPGVDERVITAMAIAMRQCWCGPKAELVTWDRLKGDTRAQWERAATMLAAQCRAHRAGAEYPGAEQQVLHVRMAWLAVFDRHQVRELEKHEQRPWGDAIAEGIKVYAEHTQHGS